MQLIDDYIIESYEYNKNNCNYYKVKCKICNHEKIISKNNIQRQDMKHSALNCKEDYYKYNYINNIYGDYKCIQLEHINNKGYFLIMQCKICGHIKRIKEHQIENFMHSASECGLEYYDNFINQIYGDAKIIKHLGIINKTNQHYFEVECIKCHRHTKLSLLSIINTPWTHNKCWQLVKKDKYAKAIENRFNNMKQRCENENNNNYIHYGKRNIKIEYNNVIDLYDDFYDELVSFANQYGLRNSTFDRIDVNGNYCKSNLRIANQNTQSTNTTRMKYFIVEKNDIRILSNSAMEFGRQFNVNGRSVGNCIRGTSKTCNGWKIIKIYTRDINIDDIIKQEKVTNKIII
jgi:ribosomal protein S27E